MYVHDFAFDKTNLNYQYFQNYYVKGSLKQIHRQKNSITSISVYTLADPTT